MAVFNEILAGRFNRALQKLTSIKGGPPVRQLGSEILAVFPLFFGAENRYLESWQRFGQGGAGGGAAPGNNSAFRLRNPAGSNVIAVIEKLTITNSTGALMTGNVEGPFPTVGDLATNLQAFTTRMDARGQQNATCVLSQTNASAFASNGNTLYQVVLAADTITDVILTDNMEIPLLPGDAIQVRDPTVNVALFGNIWWRERFLEDSERT